MKKIGEVDIINKGKLNEQSLLKQQTDKKMNELIADGGDILERMKNITNKINPSAQSLVDKKDLTKTNIINDQEKKVNVNDSNRKGKNLSLDMKKNGSKVMINNSKVKHRPDEKGIAKKDEKKKKSSKIVSSAKSRDSRAEEKVDKGSNDLSSDIKENETSKKEGYTLLIENVDKKKLKSNSPLDKNKDLNKNHLNNDILTSNTLKTEDQLKSIDLFNKDGLVSRDQLKYTERIIKEEDEDDDDKTFNPNLDCFNGISLTDQNLLILTESSKGREEKEPCKDSVGLKTPKSNRSEEKTNLIPSIIKFLHPKIFSKLFKNFKPLPKLAKTPREENRFMTLKVTNAEEESKRVKSHDRKTPGIVRVKKKKAVSLATKDLKATDDEKIEIENKIKKYIELDLMNTPDIDMNEDLRRKNELYIFNINQDIEYQLSKGTLTEEEKKRYEQLKENINSMRIDMKSLVLDFEKNFLNFKGEIENLEEVRRNEERINSYYYHLNDSRIKMDIIRQNLNRKLKIIDNKPKYKLNPILFNTTDISSQKT